MCLTGLGTEYFANGSFLCNSSSLQVIDESYNCSYFDDDCYCPQLKADPDIAGIGVSSTTSYHVKTLFTILEVIIAFVTSAALSAISTISCLSLSCASDLEDYATYNWIDRHPRRFIRQQTSEQQKPQLKRIAKCLRDLVLSLSDTQLVTGSAMLVVALKKLADGTITVYHFTIVTDLIWFSSNTHILTLIVVRSFNVSVKEEWREEGDTQTKFMVQLPNFIRASLMCVVAVLLFYASWVTGYAFWYDVPRCPAICTLHGPRGGLPARWMAVSFFYILWTYPIAIFMLFRYLRIWWIDHMRDKVIGKDDVPDFRSKGPRFVFLFIWYYFSSEIICVLEVCVWFSLGIWWLQMDRVVGHNAMDPLERIAEGTWGFGQLLPLFLLILPITQFFVSYAGK